MNSIPCAVEGCPEAFQTELGVASSARFICKNHPRNVQVAAAGRTFDPEKDTQDANVHFQDGQFTKEINPRPIRPLRSTGDTGALGGDDTRWINRTPTLDHLA